MPSRDNNARITNDKGPARENERGAEANARLQPATVEERVEELVRDYARCSRIKPTEEELAVISEKAKVWEIWDRLRRAYLGEL